MLQGLPIEGVIANGTLKVDFLNGAWGGTTCQGWDDPSSAQGMLLDELIDFHVSSRSHNIAVLGCGFNIPDDDPFAHIVSLVGKLNMAGFSEVIVQTLTGRGANFALNVQIREGAAMYGYIVADVASDPDIGCATCGDNPVYFTDGTHLTDAGEAIKTGYVKDALQSLGVP